MERQDAIKLWNELCFLLSDSIKSTISEHDFESQVIRALDKLGWQEYLGEIKRQPKIRYGRSKIMRPDIVIYNQKKNPLIVIEIKRPLEKLSKEEPADQLISYMLQLKAPFGLLIGNRIRLYYDGKETKRRSPLLLQRFNYECDSTEGEQFVNIFERSSFLKRQYKEIVKKLIDDFAAERNIKKLQEILKKENTVKKIYDFLREEHSDYGTDVVEGALNGLRIDLSYETDEGVNVDITGHEPKGGLLATVFDTVKMSKKGISTSDLMKITGFSKRQISNAIYKLTKREAVVAINRGVYKAITKEVPPKPAQKQATHHTSKKGKTKAEFKKGTVLDDLFKLIRRRKNGFSIDELRERSNLEARQLSNALYKLTKRGYIESLSRGHYRVK